MRCPEMSRILTYGVYSALRAGPGCDLAEYPETAKIRNYETPKINARPGPGMPQATGNKHYAIYFQKKNVLFFSFYFTNFILNVENIVFYIHKIEPPFLTNIETIT
jgi:hypothetical protein